MNRTEGAQWILAPYRDIDGASGTETTTYYDASKYFQKASVTDMNGHTSTMDYFDDQDTSLGNRGNVKW